MARLGKYELVRPLARGPVTELFLAREHSADGGRQPMALKRLLPQFARDMEVVSAFLKEARVASTLEHPNIARIHDVGAQGKEYFVVMEYIHGLDLDEIQTGCQKQGFFIPHNVVTQVLIQLCQGLHHAHTATNSSGQALKIVHRNVHPQNILVDMLGQVKLVDFGFTQAGESPDASKTDGAGAYRSPEQCRDEVVTCHSDIFSVGIVLYELCCRRRLFRRKTQLATNRAILEDPIPPPSAVSDEVPDALEMIIMRALARNPQYRYASAAEMATELAEAAQENAWSTKPAETASLLTRLLVDDPLAPTPTPTPLPEPQLPDYIHAGAEEDTKLENPDGLDGLRTPGGTPQEDPPAPAPAPELKDFWSVTVTPAPLPALAVDTDELPEAMDIPMIMSGELDDDGDDARTLVRSPASSMNIHVDSDPDDEELVFEMDAGEEGDPLSGVPPPAGAVDWRQQSGASLEMYSDIPEAAPLPAVQDSPVSARLRPRPRPAMGRETMEVKPVSSIPAPRTNTRAMILAALITIVVVGGGVTLLFRSMGGPRRGTVEITSAPAGAKVVLNGKERFGVTPQTISDLVLGRPHLLVVVKDGHKPWKKKITLTADKNRGSFEARLERIAVVEGEATLLLETATAGARVFFDKEFRGKTPLKIDNVACDKKHSLVFRREGFLDMVQDVDKLKSGERRKVFVTMTPAESGLKKGVLAPGRGKVRDPEDDAPVEIPHAPAPVRSLKDDSVGETLPKRVPRKLDK